MSSTDYNQSNDSQPPSAPTPAIDEIKNIEDNISSQSLKESDIEMELYQRMLHKYYFPFQIKYHSYICIAWLIIFLISFVYGPEFLISTRSDLDLPKGTPSYDAIETFRDNYPDISTWPPAFIVYHSSDIDIINPYTQKVSLNLAAFALENKDIIKAVSGYWELINFNSLISDTAVSTNNLTMMSTVYFSKDATLTQINDISLELLKFAADQKPLSSKYSSIKIYCTGLFPLFGQMQEATTQDFVTIDSIVLPSAIVILGVSLKSYRHMLIALINLMCTLLLSFAILVPVTKTVAINPFAPSIMMSLGIAVCFDYTLFMLTRYREELIDNKKSNEEAILSCLEAAGHVVLLSGLTLFLTFVLLTFFPQNFLVSVGWGCASIVITSILVNFTLTPALLLSFDCFSKFDAIPEFKKMFCCYLNSSNSEKIESVETNNESIDKNSIEMTKIEENVERNKKMNKIEYSAIPTDVIIVEEKKEKMTITENIKYFFNNCVALFYSKFVMRSIWFDLAYKTTKRANLTVFITICVTIPFFIEFINMEPTSDNGLVYLRKSSSLKALGIIEDNFPVGKMNPYQIIVATNIENSIITQPYFTYESQLINELLILESPEFINSNSITAISYFGGQSISYSTAMSYLDPLNLSPIASSYRVSVYPKLNAVKSATLIEVNTVINPNSQEVVPFIESVRDFLIDFSKDNQFQSETVDLYLFGAYTTTLDVQTSLYKFMPVMIITTIFIVMALIAVSFGSVLLALRLLFTVSISLLWTYGLMVMVYQPGSGQDFFSFITPSILDSSGIYWIIPIMSFSILVGLALDYDIFLMSRVVEYRMMGWSDRAAVCLAIEKTGSIITAAGVIMSVSFCGLLLPDTIVLNQYGFSLFIGVAIDTFFVRTFLVPAVVSSFGGSSESLFWWPRVMPPIKYTHEEEEVMLLAGLWEPSCNKDEKDDDLIVNDYSAVVNDDTTVP